MRQMATRRQPRRAGGSTAARPRWARPAGMIAATVAVALASYSVNLSVAAERADLRHIEREIAVLERDVRLLEAELGVRMRLPQLERWNSDVLALAPVDAERWLEDPLELARYGVAPAEAPPVRHAVLTDREPAPATPRLVASPAPASAPAPGPGPGPAPAPPARAGVVVSPPLPRGYYTVSTPAEPGRPTLDPSLVRLVETLAADASGRRGAGD